MPWYWRQISFTSARVFASAGLQRETAEIR
jgi:hypothetical protein